MSRVHIVIRPSLPMVGVMKKPLHGVLRARGMADSTFSSASGSTGERSPSRFISPA